MIYEYNWYLPKWLKKAAINSFLLSYICTVFSTFKEESVYSIHLFSLTKSRCTFTTYSKSIKTIQLEKNMINQEKSKSPDIRGVDWHRLNKLRCSTSQLDRHLNPRLRPCLPCSVGACRHQAHSLRDNPHWERLGSSGYHCLQKHWRRQTIHIRTVLIYLYNDMNDNNVNQFI